MMLGADRGRRRYDVPDSELRRPPQITPPSMHQGRDARVAYPLLHGNESIVILRTVHAVVVVFVVGVVVADDATRPRHRRGVVVVVDHVRRMEVHARRRGVRCAIDERPDTRDLDVERTRDPLGESPPVPHPDAEDGRGLAP